MYETIDLLQQTTDYYYIDYIPYFYNFQLLNGCI